MIHVHSPDWNQNKCVQDCDKVNGWPCNGNPPDTSGVPTELFENAQACCQRKLWWKVESTCVAESNGLDDVAEVHLSDIPLKIHRKAVQMLQEQSSSGQVPTWKDGDVTIDSPVRKLYRLDITDIPAYYEFRVSANGERAGFIIVSTGKHDFPISHWSNMGESPTEQLDNLADGRTIARYYKIDTLSYVAEDANSNIIAQTGGTLPAKVETSVRDDSYNQGVLFIEKEEDLIKISNGTNGTTILKAWGETEEEEWANMKASGSENFLSMTKSLEEDAANEWETATLLETYGEGMIAGEEKNVPLLLLNASVCVSVKGEGAKNVFIKQLDKELIIKVETAEEDEELQFHVEITYEKNDKRVKEDILFTIIPLSQTSDEDNVRRLQSWSAWTEYWADGGSSAQRNYDQIVKKQPPNTSNCYSGCGATAWAMVRAFTIHLL